MVKELGDSRIYGGIHYWHSCEKGAEQGRKIGQNIQVTLRFLK